MGDKKFQKLQEQWEQREQKGGGKRRYPPKNRGYDSKLSVSKIDLVTSMAQNYTDNVVEQNAPPLPATDEIMYEAGEDVDKLFESIQDSDWCNNEEDLEEINIDMFDNQIRKEDLYNDTDEVEGYIQISNDYEEESEEDLNTGNDMDKFFESVQNSDWSDNEEGLEDIGIDILDSQIREPFEKMEDINAALPSLSDKNNKQTIQRILPKREQRPYEYAKQIMRKEEFCYLYSPNMEGEGLYRFNGHYWEHINQKALKHLVYTYINKNLKKTIENIDTFCNKISMFIEYEMHCKYMKGEKCFTEEDFQMIENRVVFQNCVYDMLTKKTYAHSSKLPYYYEISCNYIEKSEKTPIYNKLKKDATGEDRESMDMFDYMLAYLVIPNRNGKCFFDMAYAKDSGKSILGQFIESLFPVECCKTIDLDHLKENFSLAGVDQAILLSCLEMNTSRLGKEAVAQIKKFTGEKVIRVAAKYKNDITSLIRFKLLLASNGGLYLSPNTMDDAFYRRLIVIPFIHSTPLDSLIADMPQQLQKEKSAVMSNAVRKLGNIIGDDGGIVFPESELSRNIKNQWMGKNIYIDEFICHALEYTGFIEDAIPKADIYMEYQRYYEEYAKTADDKPPLCSKRELVQEIMNIYPHVTERKVRRFSREKQDNQPRPCLCCLKWREDYNVI